MNQEKVGNETLFYDTYALYAIALGKENYKKFSHGYNVITTLMNLYELYYTLLKEDHQGLGEEFFNKLISSCMEIKSESIKESAKFRKKEIKRKLSYIDCLGYTIAKENKVKFLTGDEGFKNISNVEFVKE